MPEKNLHPSQEIVSATEASSSSSSAASSSYDTGEHDTLHAAVESGDISRVVKLLEVSTDINVKNEQGFTPLHVAAIRGNSEIVECLLERGADVHGLADVESEDYWDDQFSDYDLPRVIGTPLHEAARYGHAQVVNLLLSRGAAINFGDSSCCSALLVAIVVGHPDVVAVLIKHGADLTLPAGGHDYCFDVDDAEGNNMPVNAPIQVAAYLGRLEIVKQLLKAGVPVNTEANNGWTALHAAICGGKIEVAKLLIENGANINQVTVGDKTGLDIATSGSEEIELDKAMIALLLNAGANPHLPNEEGETALHRIAYNFPALLSETSLSSTLTLFQPSSVRDDVDSSDSISALIKRLTF